MAFSDDEEEVVPQSVMGYYLVDENELPVPFSVLPIHFDDVENTDAMKKQVFLHGTADGGLQKVFKPVTAWKLGLQDDHPEVMVLSKDKKWIKLQKPRKSYEESIRSVLITIHMLHFLKNSPEASNKSLWDYLCRVFSTFEIRPSEDDITDHLSLIKLFHERDETLAKSQLVLTYLKGKPRTKSCSEVAKKDTDVKQSFIVEDDEDDEVSCDDNGDESEEESDLFDSVCAICDNGGELLCCEGRCMRSFHATKDVGTESHCKSLGYTRAQVKAIQDFLCKNCLYKQHQCFACGKLGSSDKSAGAEVFPCVNATCGHFYHPKCVSELLFPDNELEASEYQKKIASGESFTCPVHKCVVCKQGENKEVPDLQFAMCRRCPKSYHRKCLPRKIAFDDIEEEGIIQRAWEDLLPNRILIYCLKHEIDEDLGTPRRNHIIFPEDPDKQKAMIVEKRNVKSVVKKKVYVSDKLPKDQSSCKLLKATVKPSSSEESQSSRKSASTREQVLEPQKKMKHLKDGAQPHSRKTDDRSVPDFSKLSKKEMPKVAVPTASPTSARNLSSFSSSFPVVDGETLKSKHLRQLPKVPVPAVSPTSARKKLSRFSSSFPMVCGKTSERVSALKEELSPTITLEEIIKKRTVPSTHSYSARHIDKIITHGKVEVSVEAIQTALRRLEDGANVEDAKVVCEPEIVRQIARWNNKLKVYLAPFLHGMRYTSFGRHFTKVDKLKEIADKLQWYVQSGDMIVDFCCGANDFSLIMKEKIDAAGKKCYFKNYDVIQPKNDFAFQKRDWMKVHQRELPTGSQLIMGLNPPFGLKAALANKFIAKALTFKPKLLILIVPRETARLDEKTPPYDLIWEDGEFLSGKAFYLPGSVDVNDKHMEQWNVNPPMLYLWSRSDWTSKHKVIAMKHGHVCEEQHDCAMEETQIEKPLDDLPLKVHVEKVNESGTEGNKNLEHGNKRKSPEERDDGTEGDKDLGHGNKRRLRRRRRPKRKADAVEGKKVDESFDMSGSSHRMETRNQTQDHHAPEAFEVLSERVMNHSSGSEFGLGSGDGRKTTSYEEVNEISRKYTFSGAAIDQFSSGLGGLDYRQRSEERFQNYIRESSADAYVRRLPYISDYDGYSMQSRLYGMRGQDDISQRNRLLIGGSDSSLGRGDIYSPSTYGLPNPTIGSSVMQRYAPHLDETNYLRGGPLGSGGPLHGNSGGMSDISRMRRDIPLDSEGHALGPQRHYPRQGSSG